MTLSEWCAANLDGGFLVIHPKWKDAVLCLPPVRRHHKVYLSVILPSGEGKSLSAQRLALRRKTELGVCWTVAIQPDEVYRRSV